MAAPNPDRGETAPPAPRRGARFIATRAAIVALAPLAAFAHKGLVFAFLLAALAGARRSAAGALVRRDPLIALGAALLCGWALASLSFAPAPDAGQALIHLVFIPLAALWAAGTATLAAAPREALSRTLVAAVWAAIALYALHLATGGLVMRLWYAWEAAAPGAWDRAAWLREAEDGAAVRKAREAIGAGGALLAGLVWPVAGWLWAGGRRWTAAATAAAAFACIAQLPLFSATVGTIAGGAGFAAALRWPRAAPLALLAALAGYAAAAPALSTHVLTIDAARGVWPSLPPNWEHRLGMWTYAAGEIAAADPRGAGYDASRAIARGMVMGDVTGEASPRVAEMAAIGLHPHNGVLQIRLELGLPGLAALLLMLAGLGAAFRRAASSVPSRAGATGALAAMCPPFLVGFGVWQTWWLATLGLVAGGAVLLARPPTRAGGPERHADPVR